MNKQDIYEMLQAKNIWYEVIEHPAVYNMEEVAALNLPYPEADDKNLFVRDKKKHNYYMLVVKTEKPVNLKGFAEKHGTKPLSFGSENDLMDILGVIPGSVTPLGVLNDEERKIQIFIDSDFCKTEDSIISVHPCENTATLWLKTADLIRIIEEHGNTVTVTDF